MISRPTRVIDAHVHLWDPARTDWYPYLGHAPESSTGDPTRMHRRFDVGTYRTESAAWHVDKFVNVAAATGRNSVDETLELDRSAAANGGPDAIIGGLPPADSVADSVGMLDRQMAAPRFRGIRPMGPLGDPVPVPDVLRALEERKLVFELMTHPDQLEAAATKLDGFGGLTVVVEHTGWPRSSSAEERAMWEAGVTALAGVGTNVVCKLSGLAMPFESMTVESLSPWLGFALDAFGPERCMFASNFPVDSTYGTFDDLYETFSAVTTGLDDRARDQVFAGTAARVYRL